MIDREKVIKGLECCIKNDHKTCSYKSEDKGITATPCTTFLMRDALALLEEQERKPVKPGVEHSGGGITWWNVCGACKTAINPNDKYCHECGVSIDWRPDDDGSRDRPRD